MWPDLPNIFVNTSLPWDEQVQVNIVEHNGISLIAYLAVVFVAKLDSFWTVKDSFRSALISFEIYSDRGKGKASWQNEYNQHLKTCVSCWKKLLWLGQERGKSKHFIL